MYLHLHRAVRYFEMRLCLAQSREASVLREDQVKYHELKNEFNKLQSVKADGDRARSRVKELEELLEKLKAELEREKGEKEAMKQERDTVKKQSNEVSSLENRRGPSFASHANCFGYYTCTTDFTSCFAFCSMQVIDALSQDKLSLKEQLERANERIKQMENEKQGQCRVSSLGSLLDCLYSVLYQEVVFNLSCAKSAPGC